MDYGCGRFSCEEWKCRLRNVHSYYTIFNDFDISVDISYHPFVEDPNERMRTEVGVDNKLDEHDKM